MSNQKEIFKSSEGDQWFKRNQELYAATRQERGEIVNALDDLRIKPTRVLEIGCSNGLRLNNYYLYCQADCFGIDPSEAAIVSGQKEFPHLSLQVGTADSLPFENNTFDLIVFGFCLYLCDRNDLFKIAYEADRCLADNGHLIVKDFCPPFPYRNTYTHKEGIFSFKMDHSKMFSWNPAYTEIHRTTITHYGTEKRELHDEKISAVIMHKNNSQAFPPNPYNSAQ